MSDTEEDSTSSDSWPVNEDWLIGIIKNHRNVTSKIKITDFSVKPGSHDGVSNLSDILAVAVDYQIENDSLDASRLEIIIKLLPHDPFSRYFVTEAQFDLREIKFYTMILPDLLQFQEANLVAGEVPLKISVPKCMHTHYISGSLQSTDHHHENSPEPPESILVLEDMRPFGYKSAHFTTGLTLQEAESAIKAIASVHALSLGMKIKDKIDLNEKYPFLFQTSKATDSYQQLVEQGLPQLSRFLERKGGRDKELQALTNLRPKTRSLIENLLQPIEPMGLITHTDFWCNNLLFKNSINHDCDDDNCVILDWQMVTYSRPTNDIALLLISSLPSQIRRDYTPKLLDLYYSTMKTNCSKISVDLEVDLNFDREKLQKDYKQSQLLALLLCIGSVDVALGNEEAEQRLLDVLQDFYNEGILTTDISN